MDKETLVKALIAVDDSRARSKQKAIGVSSLGDCRRKVWHQLQGHEGTNPGRRLPAILGTAIHAHIEAAVDHLADHEVMVEKRVEVEGLPPATIDYYDPTTGEVVDWKTITLKNRDYFVTQQKRWQVQTYGYLLTQAGYEVKTVTLVGIPRDGNEDDILVHSEAYDETIALEAFAWLEDLKQREVAPSPERDPGTFCAKYCAFYGDLCKGITKDLTGEAITDDTATEAARAYVSASDMVKEWEARKEAAKTALEGVSGVTIDGLKVSWSEIPGRSTPDTDAIKAALGEVPVKTGVGYSRLSVK